MSSSYRKESWHHLTADDFDVDLTDESSDAYSDSEGCDIGPPSPLPAAEDPFLSVPTLVPLTASNLASLAQDERINSDEEPFVDQDAMSVASVPMSTTSSERREEREREEEGQEPYRPSTPMSVVSLTRSMRQAATETMFGREIQSYSDTYQLPADRPENARLQKQHLMFLAAMGGKYCPPMADVMQPDYKTGRRKRVVDLGCGTAGSWILDVAHDFPFVDAVGIDLVPMAISENEMPDNCRSEVDDLNFEMAHFYESFDVCHTRLIASGIRDYGALIHEAANMLLPGGLLDITEWDFGLYDENLVRITVDTDSLDAPYLPRFFAFVSEAVSAFRGDVRAADYMYDEVLAHEAFEEVTYRDFWLSSCPWTTNNPWQMTAVGAPMTEDILAFTESAKPLLLNRGHDIDLVNTLVRNAQMELIKCHSRTWVRLQCVTARKRSDYRLRGYKRRTDRNYFDKTVPVVPVGVPGERPALQYDP